MEIPVVSTIIQFQKLDQTSKHTHRIKNITDDTTSPKRNDKSLKTKLYELFEERYVLRFLQRVIPLYVTPIYLEDSHT